MDAKWKAISSNDIARSITEKVCWEDSSLMDSVFCRTTLNTEEIGRVSGRGLRVLISCCSAPTSHLELAFLAVTQPVAMPIELSCFSAQIAENGQLRFGFHSDAYPFQCHRGFFRFIDISHSEANELYLHPSILEPPVSQLSTEGFIAFEAADGGQVVLSGKIEAPKLFVQPKGAEGCEVSLDRNSARQLMSAIHYASTL